MSSVMQFMSIGTGVAAAAAFAALLVYEALAGSMEAVMDALP